MSIIEEIFNGTYKPTKWERFRWKINDIWTSILFIPSGIKIAYQRAKKGYSYYDVYDVHAYLIKLIPNMLRDLAKTTHGYPCIDLNDATKDLNDPITAPDTKYCTYEEWCEYLNKLADSFEEYDRFFIDEVDSAELNEKLYKSEITFNEYNTIVMEKRKVLTDEMKKIFDIFGHLWD